MLTRYLDCCCIFLFALSLLVAPVPPAFAEPSAHDPALDVPRPDGIHVLDGSCVLNMGELQINITNHGLIGSQYSAEVPYASAPSGQWPGGSGDEYLWGAGLWIGGRIAGQVSVTTGQYERELRPGPDFMDTIFEAKNGVVTRPIPSDHATGRRYPSLNSNDDFDGERDEDILNGRDDDGDGLVDEDFAQLGDQMFVCDMYDDLGLVREMYPDHRPLGVRVRQRAFCWYEPELENVVGLDFEISNVGLNTIEDMYLGMLVDCDIQSRTAGSNEPDDLAGFFDGAVRGDDNLFYRANIAYMRDGAVDDPLPGVFGLMLIDHTTEFIGRDAPLHPEFHAYQAFATNASVSQQGEPTVDLDRYTLMAQRRRDPNTHPDEANDFKFMVSSGPFNYMVPGKTINYRVAMIIGHGMQGMLETAAQAGRVGAGRYFNLDGDYYTGYSGRETKVCLGDYRPYDGGIDPIIGHRINFMNNECAGTFGVFGQEMVHEGNLEFDVDGRKCIWVNMDNCEECFRIRGEECTPETFHSTYRGRAYTGTGGRETHYHWSLYQEIPPPSPGIRVMPGDNQVEVFWDDRSEHTLDPVRLVDDFESYRVWKLHHWTRPAGLDPQAIPPSDMWGLVAEFDVESFIEEGIGNASERLALGLNTGLEDIAYTPACLGDERFAGLAEVMQDLVDGDPENTMLTLPGLRQRDGSITPGLEGLARWESHRSVLDTFFAVTARAEAPGVEPKRGVRYYHYLDREGTHNGFFLYYAVTAMDHELFYIEDRGYFPVGQGVTEEPGNNYVTTTPRPDSQTLQELNRDGRNIYVYPNPATRESLQEYLAQLPSLDDPTGVRVTWNNLPRAHNTIHIYTESLDLVKTIRHDGFSEGGSTSWNLVSRNRQEVTSGIYLYVVKSDGGFPDFQGRFVVIR